VDTYRTAAAVNLSYALTISPTAYGYKVSDSLAGFGSALPVSVEQVYNFFNKKNSPSRFVTEGFAAVISGFPTPVNYSDEDEIFLFPLSYGDVDSTTFRLAFSLPTFGGFVQKGYRKTVADGWGTIITPFFTTPTPALRVRAEIVEVDSVSFGTTSFGFPRTTVEYKWLVNGEHYPALYVTTNKVANIEQVARVSYRDSRRALSAGSISARPVFIGVSPNPGNALFTVSLPQSWQSATVEVFDATGKLILTQKDRTTIDLQASPAGNYFVRATNGTEAGYAQLVKR
jgi:hypothetical protein